MRLGKLSDYFMGVGVKRLSAVDANPVRSNQHEVGTTRAMREQFLGERNRKFRTIYIWLGDEQDAMTIVGQSTHYDSRKTQKHRAAEWRLYYESNDVTGIMNEGDVLFLALHESGILYFIVAAGNSSGENQLSKLFGMTPKGARFASRQVLDTDGDLNFAARYILDEIGVEFEDPEADKIDDVIKEFGLKFPKTQDMSDRARLVLNGVDPLDDPDEALLQWISLEEAMFRRLEKKIISARLKDGFINKDGSVNIDEFISYSLSVQNRRKSRMGYSLENHLEAIFRSFKIKYARGVVLENGQRPDFIFPSAHAYNKAAKGDAGLFMLGAKSTCKDRWRQVLAEADKIPHKHLLTLEWSISKKQTFQMQHERLQLIVPKSIQAGYAPDQQSWLWTLKDFIEVVK